MPISRHARWMRNAISPRLAMRIFSNMVCGVSGSADYEQRLTELDGLAVLHQDLGDGAGHVGIDFVEELHRFDDAQGIAFLHGRTDVDEGRGARGRGAVEGAD